MPTIKYYVQKEVIGRLWGEWGEQDSHKDGIAMDSRLSLYSAVKE